MKSLKFSLIFLVFISFAVNAQVITGVVRQNDLKMESLPGATVLWQGTTLGTITDASGSFAIEKTGDAQQSLIISYVGYKPDTVAVENKLFLDIRLDQANELSAVKVTGQASSTAINTINPVNLEILTTGELKKAACCNLSESFETTGTVDVNYSDAITGAKTIRLLGLDGIYAQIMTENMPAVRGLSSSYGLTFIPGSWIDQIQVTKGPGSVVNGYESIAGAINTELKKPYDKEKWLFNIYGNTSGRWDANINFSQALNSRLSTGLFLSTAQLNNKLDDNSDGFLDAPLTHNYLLMNRWDYHSGKIYEWQGGIKLISSDLLGGQLTFNKDAAHSLENGYGVGIQIRRMELYAKNGFVFKRPNTSIGFIVNNVSHDQQSYFGLNVYSGKENYLNANLIGQTYIFNTSHLLKAGLSYMADHYHEAFDSIPYVRKESVPGIFTEYYYALEQKWSILAGARADFHNLYGVFFSPRLHLKYSFTPKTTLRASAGKGYRVANIFAENTSILTSSRQLIIEESLKPEVGWNYGLTFIHSFALNEEEGTFTFDAYRTDFINQVVIGLDADVHEIIVSNLHGPSYSNALQAQINYTLVDGLDIRLVYKYVDAKESYQDQLLEVPFINKNRGLVNLSYKTRKGGWAFDFTSQYYGSARLPSTVSNPAVYRFPDRSPDYVLLLGQVSKKFKGLDVYIGTENLTNYTQTNAIIAANDPFGDYFDASMVYAPVMTRTFYAGLRFTLNK